MSISFEDYKLPDGSIDWKSYGQARRNNGELCHRCGRYIHLDTCDDCKGLDENERAVTSETFVRCPKCKRVVRPGDDELYQLFDDGEHVVGCNGCGQEFEVSVSVRYTFKSPPLIG